MKVDSRISMLLLAMLVAACAPRAEIKSSALTPEPARFVAASTQTSIAPGADVAWYAQIREAGYPDVADIVRRQDLIGCKPSFVELASGETIRIVFPPGEGDCNPITRVRYPAQCPLRVALAEPRGKIGNRDKWHWACYIPSLGKPEAKITHG